MLKAYIWTIWSHQIKIFTSEHTRKVVPCLHGLTILLILNQSYELYTISNGMHNGFIPAFPSYLKIMISCVCMFSNDRWNMSKMWIACAIFVKKVVTSWNGFAILRSLLNYHDNYNHHVLKYSLSLSKTLILHQQVLCSICLYFEFHLFSTRSLPLF